MKTSYLALTLLMMLIPSTSSLAASSSATLKTAPTLTRYIIQYKNPDALTMSQPLLQSFNIKPLRTLRSVNAVVADLTPRQRHQLSKDSAIALIEPDPVRQLQNDQTPWGITRVQAPMLSDSAAGNRTVCIIDTGYDLDHEDLMTGPNVTGEVIDSIQSKASPGEWSDDEDGHGTDVAGVITTVDNPVGLIGINPGNRINLHIVKINHSPDALQIWGSDLVAAVEACQEANANVINVSIGGVNKSMSELRAMQIIYDQGALLFAAAGNQGTRDYFYPASYDAVIAVGAISKRGEIWQNSQQNEQIEFVAPGIGITSTLPNNSYGNNDGSSIASAFAAGIAALVWSHHPDCTATQIRHVLALSAKDMGENGRDISFGFGEIQAEAALNALDTHGCNHHVSP